MPILVLHLLELLYVWLIFHLYYLVLALELVLFEVGLLRTTLRRVGLDPLGGLVGLHILELEVMDLCSFYCRVLSGRIFGGSIPDLLSWLGQNLVLSVSVGPGLDDGPVLEVVGVGLQLILASVLVEGLLVPALEVGVPLASRVMWSSTLVLSGLMYLCRLEAHSWLILVLLMHDQRGLTRVLIV